MNSSSDSNVVRKPKWLTTQLPTGKMYMNVRDIVKQHKLHTICESGKCPNMGECWGAGTATFMILGDICTRSCRFCNVKTGRPNAVDTQEPANVARSIQLMGLRHAVLTSVDRDDLPDGGSAHWAEVVRTIRETTPGVSMETLIPDFQGNTDQLDRLIKAAPEVISHNLETVRRMTKLVRVQAQYNRSLEVLRYLKEKGMTTKSGLMVGIGETEAEIYETMDDLRAVNCEILTIGQYLQPSKAHLPVARYVEPEEFARYKKAGLEKGFKVVESGPLVRSSYHAEKHLYEK